jgi:hypothetical protein
LEHEVSRFTSGVTKRTFRKYRITNRAIVDSKRQTPHVEQHFSHRHGTRTVLPRPAMSYHRRPQSTQAPDVVATDTARKMDLFPPYRQEKHTEAKSSMELYSSALEMTTGRPTAVLCILHDKNRPEEVNGTFVISTT